MLTVHAVRMIWFLQPRRRLPLAEAEPMRYHQSGGKPDNTKFLHYDR